MFIFFVVFSILICASADKEQDELEIISQHIPDECYDKTATGDEILVHYVGQLENGEVFYSSLEQDPLYLKLGHGDVIDGWNQGLLGMCVGERRLLIIPPQMGFGSEGLPPIIPPNSKIMIETQLIAINRESIDDVIVRFARPLIYPAIAGIILYYLYYKYQREKDSRKIEKASRKIKKTEAKKSKRR